MILALLAFAAIDAVLLRAAILAPPPLLIAKLREIRLKNVLPRVRTTLSALWLCKPP